MSNSTALTPIERAAVALRSTEREVILKGFVVEAKEIRSITNVDGYKQCRATRMTLKSERVAIEKQAKQAREDATTFSKAVIAEEKRLIGIISPEEERLEKIQKEWDDKIEAEKQAKIDVEIKRVERIRAAINSIRAFVIDVAGKNSSTIADVFHILKRETIEKSWYEEFTEEAANVKAEVLEKLSMIHQAAVNHETEQSRVIAEREELTKLRVEQEERLRVEREMETLRRAEEEARIIVERQIEAKRIADEQAAVRAKLDAEEVLARALRQEADRIAEDKHKAEQAILDAQRAEINNMLEAQEAEIKRREVAEKEKELTFENIVIASDPLDHFSPLTNETASQMGLSIGLPVETVTITKAEYDELVEDSETLSVLRMHGVDNWEGYDNAIASLEADDLPF